MTPEEEIKVLRRRIAGFNEGVSSMIAQRHEAQERIVALEARRNVNTEFVILSARHLDPEEGVMRAGHVVTSADIMAVRTVLGFVSAHKDCGAAT